jgi:hypothetical protein
LGSSKAPLSTDTTSGSSDDTQARPSGVVSSTSSCSGTVSPTWSMSFDATAAMRSPEKSTKL